ncbi:uncharacterized protein LOC120772280 [Bactrocera tryoni]|uniref:uncharacterized protein LOC120772280 n=1 Tax=Bactrocera tryoni TaxID=59916 RepID=UPI001A96DDF2|nr:uncharacterized protein LOC120772280 [Bactrocera tryoni]
MFSAEAALELENKINEFPYVVAEFKKPEIAFGSGTERFTRKSTRDKRRRARVKFIIREQLETPTYKYGLLHNYPSNRGYTAMANRSPRFKLPPESKYPAPNAYVYERPQTAAKMSYPFNTSDARSRLPSGKPIGPSPCDYYLYRRRMQPVEMGFGTQRYVIPGYAVFCGSENKSRCLKCQTQPVGDYYHNFDVHLDLCRPCMNAELAELNNCKYNRLKRSSRLRELGKFKPARWCHFYHKHYYGNLAVNKFPVTTLRLKNRVENYLQSYDKLLQWYVQY